MDKWLLAVDFADVHSITILQLSLFNFSWSSRSTMPSMPLLTGSTLSRFLYRLLGDSSGLNFTFTITSTAYTRTIPKTACAIQTQDNGRSTSYSPIGGSN